MAETHDKNGHKVDGKGDVTYDPQCSVCAPMSNEIKKKAVEFAERATTEYANLSGRESANRAEFRERVTVLFCKALTDIYALGREEALKEAEDTCVLELDEMLSQGYDAEAGALSMFRVYLLESFRSLRTKGKV